MAMTTTINESSSEKKESDAILPKKSSHGLGLVGAAMFIVVSVYKLSHGVMV